MQKYVTTLKKFWKHFRAFFPSPLPLTPAAHTAWASEILDLGGFPDNSSFRHALATMVMHLPQLTTYKSKVFFVWNLKRSIANQTAYQVMTDIKEATKNEQSVQEREVQETAK